MYNNGEHCKYSGGKTIVHIALQLCVQQYIVTVCNYVQLCAIVCNCVRCIFLWQDNTTASFPTIPTSADLFSTAKLQKLLCGPKFALHGRIDTSECFLLLPTMLFVLFVDQTAVTSQRFPLVATPPRNLRHVSRLQHLFLQEHKDMQSRWTLAN